MVIKPSNKETILTVPIVRKPYLALIIIIFAFIVLYASLETELELGFYLFFLILFLAPLVVFFPLRFIFVLEYDLGYLSRKLQIFYFITTDDFSIMVPLESIQEIVIDRQYEGVAVEDVFEIIFGLLGDSSGVSYKYRSEFVFVDDWQCLIKKIDDKTPVKIYSSTSRENVNRLVEILASKLHKDIIDKSGTRKKQISFEDVNTSIIKELKPPSKIERIIKRFKGRVSISKNRIEISNYTNAISVNPTILNVIRYLFGILLVPILFVLIIIDLINFMENSFDLFLPFFFVTLICFYLFYVLLLTRPKVLVTAKTLQVGRKGVSIGKWIQYLYIRAGKKYSLKDIEILRVVKIKKNRYRVELSTDYGSETVGVFENISRAKILVTVIQESVKFLLQEIEKSSRGKPTNSTDNLK